MGLICPLGCVTPLQDIDHFNDDINSHCTKLLHVSTTDAPTNGQAVMTGSDAIFRSTQKVISDCSQLVYAAPREADEHVNNIKFLGIHITSDLTWSMNTAHLLLTNFYRATIESILCLSAAVWYGSCTAAQGSPLPDLDSIYAGQMQKKARHIAADPTHPGNGLFVPLPSGTRLLQQQLSTVGPSCWRLGRVRVFPQLDFIPPEIQRTAGGFHDPSVAKEMKLRIVSAKIDSCVVIVTETWLDNNIPDAAVELAGRSLLRADRTAASEKHRGGGLALYIHNAWCTATNFIGTYCSPDLEYLAVKCRPFKMARELCSILIVAIYIPPQANAKNLHWRSCTA
ncbi:hypothetical protein L3Q82_005833 [Scortum barcoo]|uniref:Uncharacterized protein n=1 Tax=Scortum barcoo TaxID=214431 RepID=A0ACB8V6U4_9TELE|nr:hypothetical protein L3Q82_005833 [Scortum barcoo]